MHDEILDIVNEHDQVIGTVPRSNVGRDTCGKIRVVLAFLVDQDGRIGLLRRTAQKTTDPLSWALVGGCVSSGEDYDTAIIRETAEEINLNPDDYQISLLGYYPPHLGWVNEYGVGFYKKVYQIRVKSSEILYNPDDFSQIVWKTPREFIAGRESEHYAKGVIWLIEQLYL